ncbi:carbohydrate ABC transporter permease [Paenibacillus eucommiae]|uniref:ABC-type glycerol-3-phosphate transport system permease component n=1 Tax=Paenibacillus eucommiae TaxID=1355755 RepID=A0ABS4J1A3_9BACL|nr:carbohydrate ABC transporter permease [Paenibacillus eucommiae]MBP1993612.1 ABC-type glycerol-3-phosphate transport system permease component [Paenibacillus eucommiae]
MRMRLFAKRLRNAKMSNVILYVILTALAVFMALPLVYIFNHAFKPLHEMFLFPPTFLVQQPTIGNFTQLFNSSTGDLVPFTRYLFNSVLISIVTIASVILVSSLAAYALAVKQFPFKALVMSLIMVSLMFAPETVAIPRYLIVSGLGITDTYFAHILPFLASPVAVFLLIQFMGQIPNELIDAAKLDGASEFGIFRKVVLPLAAPAVATIAIISFQGVWTDVEGSTLFVHDETMKTMAYYVTTLATGIAGQNISAAAGLLMFLPTFIIFLLFQRKVNETMVHSGVK